MKTEATGVQGHAVQNRHTYQFRQPDGSYGEAKTAQLYADFHTAQQYKGENDYVVVLTK